MTAFEVVCLGMAVLAFFEKIFAEKRGLFIGTILATVLNVVALISLLDLIRFHTWLQKRGLSTFDWIRFKREGKVIKETLTKE